MLVRSVVRLIKRGIASIKDSTYLIMKSIFEFLKMQAEIIRRVRLVTIVRNSWPKVWLILEIRLPETLWKFCGCTRDD